ncbi:MAG: GNAT family N-acetyltransferase [Leucobacter sp.]
MTLVRTSAGGANAAAIRAMSDRDRLLDPQLPARGFDDGAELLASVRGDQVRAVGLTSLQHLDAGDGEALWGALHRAGLELCWDGDLEALGELLDGWIAEAAPRLVQGEPGDPREIDPWETSFDLKVPARDTGLVQPLLSRGFSVVTVEAIRLGDRGGDAARTLERLAGAGLSLRPATSDDLPLLGELDSELLDHDCRHGRITRRPNAEAVLRAGIEERLRLDPELTWMIEQRGEPIGYLSIESGRDHYLERAAPGGRLAFLQAMYLRPQVRGSGLGEAVVEFAHGSLAEAGYERIMLDYAALNPRSGPFWCRMGYRPLWHTWQRRPARV